MKHPRHWVPLSSEPPPTRFKVGDRVRLAAFYYPLAAIPWKIARVLAIRPSGYVLLRPRGRKTPQRWYHVLLEPAD